VPNRDTASAHGAAKYTTYDSAVYSTQSHPFTVTKSESITNACTYLCARTVPVLAKHMDSEAASSTSPT
jgi:hypothetical protein